MLDVPSVKFPSGVVRDEPGHDNLCETCHRGREAKATVDAQIATGKYKFMNVHYLPAGATKLGAAVHVGYEYDGKTYAGPLAHTGGAQCTSCHDPAGSHHTFQITDAWDGRCKTCHADANGDPKNIRLRHLADYDGDGNTSEALAAEIDGLAAKVLAAMQGAAALCYDGNTYPYFFKDTNGDKQCAASEVVVDERLQRLHARADEGGVQLPARRARSRGPGPTTSTTWRSCSTTASPISAAA